MRKRFSVFSLIVSCLCVAAVSAQAAPKIGVASAVRNDVQRVVGSGGQPLAVGSDVFTNERIRTGEASTAQILFLDKTSLTVGSRAEITLDRFVFNPSKGAGQVVLSALNGAFRFVTGSQDPRNYTVRTPVGVIGVRGTIFDGLMENNPRPELRKLTVILVEGSLSITFNGQTYTLTKPGTAFIFLGDGTVQGPVAWDGTIFSTDTAGNFPLYGWRFNGQQTNNGLPDVNLGNIDQLNAIIQHQLPPPTPPCSEYC
ncbi:MAG TPA: FecR domain-containing protein, partial [Burkholderiales bacterium]|nr:FecR domain-containing protein [Burkholderiales bacterium]